MHLATLESHSEQRGWLTSYQSIKIEILNISSRLYVEWMQHTITNMNSTTFKNLTLTEQMLSGELWQESAKKPSGFDQRHSRRHPTPSAHRTIKTPTQSCYPKRPSFIKASTIDCIIILRRVLWIIPFRYLKCLNASMYVHVFNHTGSHRTFSHRCVKRKSNQYINSPASGRQVMFCISSRGGAPLRKPSQCWF